MAERTNAQLLKSCEVQASVGSNPTPSALVLSRDIVDTRTHARLLDLSVASLVAPCRIDGEVAQELAVEGDDLDVEVGDVEPD